MATKPLAKEQEVERVGKMDAWEFLKGFEWVEYGAVYEGVGVDGGADWGVSCGGEAEYERSEGSWVLSYVSWFFELGLPGSFV